MKPLMLFGASLLLASQLNAQVSGGALPAPPTPPAPATSTSNSYSYKHTSTVNGKTKTYNYHSSDQDLQDDPMKSKTFSKSFPLGKGEKVNLSNTFGTVTIKTWDKNEAKLDADIKAYANDEDEAQKLIDNVSIEANKSGDDVTFKTNMSDRNGNWGNGSRNGKKWRREVKVNVTLYLPSTAALNVSHQYGNVTMENFAGPTSLKVQYGNLTAGNLSNKNNYINVQYGKTTLQNVNEANIKHQYGSGLTIANINDLELDAQYAGVRIGAVKNNAQVKLQYGSGISIESAGSLSATLQYAGLNLGKLGGTFTGKVQYGKINVNEIESGCKIFNADAQYSPVSVGFSSNYNANFNVSTDYGSFRYGDNITSKKLGDDDDRRWNSSKKYEGKVGRGGTNTININSTYNSITFK